MYRYIYIHIYISWTRGCLDTRALLHSATRVLHNSLAQKNKKNEDGLDPPWSEGNWVRALKRGLQGAHKVCLGPDGCVPLVVMGEQDKPVHR